MELSAKMMDIKEYESVKKLNYDEYCDYLQQKYGRPWKSYFSKKWINQTPCILRTGEGLVIHHKREDKVPLLEEVEIAKVNPFEWQLPKNLVYCDFLEHLYLHILIAEQTSNKCSLAVYFESQLEYLGCDFYRKSIVGKQLKCNPDVCLELIKRGIKIYG